MKIKKMSILIFLFLNVGMLLSFDELFEKKLKHIEQFKPGTDWTFLKFDDSFALNFTVPESLIKSATCVKVKENRIYVVDNNDHKFLIFDKNGNFIKKIGQHGRGPGDLHWPNWLEIYENNIYIVNNNGIDIFGKDLKFINRIRHFLLFREFSIDSNYIYCSPLKPYKGKYPLFLKLNMQGGVEEAIYSDDLKDREDSKENLFQISKMGSILTFENKVVYVPRHWNRIYIYHNKSRLLERFKIKYDLLDKIEEWNQRNINRKVRNKTWFSNIFVSAKNFKGKIYILLKIPRLEIISIDSKGNIQEHFFNDVDFRFMRWKDFYMEEKGDKLFFYVLGYSLGNEKKRDLTEYGVHRVISTSNEKKEK